MKPLGLLALFAAGLALGLYLASDPTPTPDDHDPAHLQATSRPAIEPLFPDPNPPRREPRPDPAPSLALTARIADRVTNAPLPGAELALIELLDAAGAPDSATPPRPPSIAELATAVADEDGRVLLSLSATTRALPAFHLRLSAPGYVSRAQPLTVAPTLRSQLELGWLFLDAEPAAGARLTGRLHDAHDAPIPGALLLLGSDPLYPLADARAVGRSGPSGELVLDALVAASDRSATQYLFALAESGLAWTPFRLEPTRHELALPDLTLVPNASVVVEVLDPSDRSLGNATVEARARFYPLAGLFDAREPGFAPEPRVLERFRAVTNGFGTATFDRLPAPFASGVYEFASTVPGIGTGTVMLESTRPGAEHPVVLRLEPE